VDPNSQTSANTWEMVQDRGLVTVDG